MKQTKESEVDTSVTGSFELTLLDGTKRPETTSLGIPATMVPICEFTVYPKYLRDDKSLIQVIFVVFCGVHRATLRSRTCIRVNNANYHGS